MMAATRHEDRSKKWSLATVKLDGLIFWTVIMLQILLSRSAVADATGQLNNRMIES